jgi:hypothetical protein
MFERIAPSSWLAALVLASGAAAAATATSAPPPSSTFQASCRNIAITGSTVTAECRRNNGTYKHTWLRIAGVENLNGTLHYVTMYQASTFQDSCKDMTIAGAEISAMCLKDDGSLVKTSIAIPGMVNSDGDLAYAHTPPPK